MEPSAGDTWSRAQSTWGTCRSLAGRPRAQPGCTARHGGASLSDTQCSARAHEHVCACAHSAATCARGMPALCLCAFLSVRVDSLSSSCDTAVGQKVGHTPSTWDQAPRQEAESSASSGGRRVSPRDRHDPHTMRRPGTGSRCVEKGRRALGPVTPSPVGTAPPQERPPPPTSWTRD